MSQIFLPSSEGFEVQPIKAAGYRLVVDGGAGRCVEAIAADAAAPADTLLLRVPELPDRAESWALLPNRAARVLRNGEPLVLGLAVLRHRDELRVDGAEAFYFSTERLAVVEPCARDDAPRCPRCAQAIERGEPAVRCPGCGVLHHQLSDRPCWTHLPRCALCDQSTDLAAGFRWTPEAL